MITTDNYKIGFIFNLIALGNCIFACIISLIVLIGIISYLTCNRMKQEYRIIMILCIYIYLFILIYVILVGSLTVNSLLGDLYQYNFYSSWCIFRAYLATVILATLYCVCVNQVIDFIQII